MSRSARRPLAIGLALGSFVALASLGSTARAADAGADAGPFAYDPPGTLTPEKAGRGRPDDRVYVPGLRFPLESGPAFANSQVWNPGGGEGPENASQCEASNYAYPWRDNYCESRTWDMPLCPSGTGHQGQDIRAATCEKAKHTVVAVVDGTITNVGSYSVYITTADGTRFDYLHMSNVLVKEGDVVKRGQPIGKVSNQFGSSATTIHLHLNIRQNIDGLGLVFVPPYMTLIRAYEDLMGLNEPDASVPPPAPTPQAPAPAPQVAPPEPEPEPEGDDGCQASPSSAPPVLSLGVLGLAALGTLLRKRRATIAKR